MKIDYPSPKADPDLVSRIIKFYQDDIDRQPALSPIWAEILTRFYVEPNKVLRSGNVTDVTAMLENVCSDCTIFGMEIGASYAKREELLFIEKWMRKLIAAANSVGVVDVFNPEQSPAPSPFDYESIVKHIEFQCDLSLNSKGFGCLPGIIIGNRFITVRTLECVCVESAIRRQIQKPNVLLELGAGLGTMSLVTNAKQYHTVDLAFPSVLQSYRLGIEFGPSAVRIGNEPDTGQRFHIHGSSVAHLPEVDVFLNQDSLPEMPVEIAKHYLQSIRDRMTKSSRFLSINHESRVGGQTPVRELIHDLGFRCLYRAPYWAREGYVEEMFEKGFQFS